MYCHFLNPCFYGHTRVWMLSLALTVHDYLFLQNRYSVQYDDLFKKAWEEEVIEESRSDGESWLLNNSKMFFFFFYHVNLNKTPPSIAIYLGIWMLFLNGTTFLGLSCITFLTFRLWCRLGLSWCFVLQCWLILVGPSDMKIKKSRNRQGSICVYRQEVLKDFKTVGIESCNKGIPWKVLLWCSLLFAKYNRYNIIFPQTLREEDEMGPFCFEPQESRFWAWPHFFPHSSHHCWAIGSLACLPFFSSFSFPFGFVPPSTLSQSWYP